eukprot:3784898-Rhodomonas_salina.1
MQSTSAVGGKALISSMSHVCSLIPACSGATEGWDIAPAGFAYAVCALPLSQCCSGVGYGCRVR